MFDPTQNAADPNGGINSQPQNGDDSGAPQQAAPASPQSGQPQSQPAQAQNPPQQNQATPPGVPADSLKPGSFFKNLSHSFAGSVLAAVAGRQPTRYIVDATGKTVPDPNQPQASTGDKLRSIASNALQGLAAGASVPPQKSKAASLAAGLGAGAQAQSQSADAKDALNRKNANEDYEREQQQLLRKHDIARANLTQYATTIHMLNERQDRDPEVAKNKDIVKAYEDDGRSVQYISDTELQARMKADPTFIVTHHMLPLGTEPTMGKDAAGNPQPLMDEDGNPILQGRIAVVDGMTDGKFIIPPSMVADAKKYGAIGGAGGSFESLEPGQELSDENFARLHGAILEGKKQEHIGWVTPKTGFLGTGKDRHAVEINTMTGETRVPKAELNVEDKPSESAAKTAKDLSDAGKADRSGEVTDQDRFKENQENYRAQLAKTATKGTELQKQGVASLQKQSDAYSQFATTAASLKSSLAAAKNGNELAAAVAPLQGTLFITTAEGVKRINETELKGVSGAGSLVQRINGALSKTKGGGPLSDSLKDDMAKLVDIYTDSKYSGYEKQAKYTQKLHGLDPTTTPILDRDGNIVMTDDSSSQSGQAAKGGQGGGKTAQNPPPQPTGHKVGDQIKQNGKVLTVTAVDANGKVTGAK